MRAVLVALLLVVLVVVPVGGDTIVQHEDGRKSFTLDFEEYGEAQAVAPAGASWWARTTTGAASSHATTTTAATGNVSWRITPGAAAATVGAVHQWADLCAEGARISWAFRITADWSQTGVMEVANEAGATPGVVRWEYRPWAGAFNLSAQLLGAAGAVEDSFNFTVAPDAWHRAQVEYTECVTATIVIVALTGTGEADTLFSDAAVTEAPRVLLAGTRNAAGSLGSILLDDMRWHNVADEGVASIPGANVVVDSHQFIETYEDDVAGLKPSQNWYTYFGTHATQQVVSGGAAVGSRWFDQGANSEHVRLGRAGPALDLRMDGCKAGTSLDFWFKPITRAATGNQMLFGWLNSTSGDFAGLSWTTTADEVRLQASDFSAGNVGGSTTLPVVLGTWYHVKMTVTSCAVTFGMTATIDGVGSLTLTHAGSALSELPTLGTTASSGGRSGRAGWDHIRVIDQSPDRTLATTALTGFDVAYDGSVAIERYSGGDLVRTLDAKALDPGEPDDTLCNRVDGVTATPEIVSYLDCEAGGDVDSVKLRGPNLQAPVFPAGCTGCIADIPVSHLDRDPDDAGEWSDLAAFPLDYSLGADDGTGFFSTAWGYSTITGGSVGALTYTVHKDGAEFIRGSNHAERVVDPTGAGVDQVCLAHSYDTEEALMYGGSQQSNTLGWKITLQPGFHHGAGGGLSLLPVFERIFGGASITAATIGVACGNDTFIVATADDTVSAWRRGNSTPLWSVQGAADGSGTVGRGVADDESGEWAAFVLDGYVMVAEMDTGTVVWRGLLPAGNLHSVHLDGHAQNIWLAYADKIVTWSIHHATTVEPKAFDRLTFANERGDTSICGTNCVGPGGSGATDPLASASGAICSWIPGTANPAVLLFMQYGWAVLAGVVAWAATANRGDNGRGGHGPTILGAGFLGLCIGVPACGLSAGVPLMVAVVAVAAIVMVIKRGGS